MSRWRDSLTGSPVVLAAVAVVLALALATGSPARSVASEYTVRPDDRLRVRIFQFPELSGEYVVGTAGTISIPPIGEVHVAGLPARAAAERIAEHFIRSGLSQRPGAAVELVQSRPVYVMGDVQRPGEYPFRPGLTALQAISLAGGYFRFTDPGLMRLERDAISGRGELRTLYKRIDHLMARRARLHAEIEDRSDIVFPPELTGREKSDPAVAELMQEERTLLTINQNALRRQLESLQQTRALYEREIDTINEQIKAEKRQFDSVEKELREINALASRGLASMPRQTGLERILAQIMGAEQNLRTVILRARQNITTVEQRSFELQNERRARLNGELQQTRLELEDVRSRIETTRKLIVEAEHTTPLTALRQRDEASEPRALWVLRSQNGTGQRFPADEQTSLDPGDVLRVERLPTPVETSDAGPPTVRR